MAASSSSSSIEGVTDCLRKMDVEEYDDARAHYGECRTYGDDTIFHFGPVMRAVLDKNSVALREALENPKNLENINECESGYGLPPLHAACAVQDLECVRALVEKEEVCLSAYDHQGHTPVHTACKVGNLEIVKIFIEAIPEDDEDLRKIMLGLRTKPCQLTPLHTAAYGRNPKVIVPYLLDHGARAVALDVDDNYPSDYCFDLDTRILLEKKEVEELKELEDKEAAEQEKYASMEGSNY